MKALYSLLAVACWYAMAINLAEGHRTRGLVEGVGGVAWFVKLLRHRYAEPGTGEPPAPPNTERG